MVTCWDHCRDMGLERLCLWDDFTPLILGAGRESCLNWVCLCLCLSGSCVFVVFLSRLRGPAWSPLSQLLLCRRSLSSYKSCGAGNEILWAQRRWFSCPL